MNALKVKTINKKLEKIKTILEGEPTTEFLETLDEESLPTNSDAVLMITQFKAAMEQFKKKFYGQTAQFASSRWFTSENPGKHYRDF